MPFCQVVAERANNVLNRANVNTLQLTSAAQSLTSPDRLVQFLMSLGIIQTSYEEQFMRTFPQTLQESLLAVFQHAIQANPRIPVTVAWLPGYDYEVTIGEARSIVNSAAHITVLLRSPYPTT